MARTKLKSHLQSLATSLLKEGLAKKRLRAKGQKRATTYFAP